MLVNWTLSWLTLGITMCSVFGILTESISAILGYVLTILGAKHLNFADIQFTDLPPDSPFQVVMNAAKPELIRRITCDYLLAMFDTYLRAKTASPLLDGSQKPYSEVVLGRFLKE